jgi:hypothetical protein
MVAHRFGRAASAMAALCLLAVNAPHAPAATTQESTHRHRSASGNPAKGAKPALVVHSREELLRVLGLPPDFDIDEYSLGNPYTGTNAKAVLVYFMAFVAFPDSDETVNELRSNGLYQPYVDSKRKCLNANVNSLTISPNQTVAGACYTTFEIANLLSNMDDDTLYSLCFRSHLFGDKRTCKSGDIIYALKSQFPELLAIEDAANLPGTYPEPADIFDKGEPPAQALAEWDAKLLQAQPRAYSAGQDRVPIANPNEHVTCPCKWP